MSALWERCFWEITEARCSPENLRELQQEMPASIRLLAEPDMLAGGIALYPPDPSRGPALLTSTKSGWFR